MKERILILGDDVPLRETVCHALAELPAEIHSRSFNELLPAIRHLDFGIVILLSMSPLLSHPEIPARLRPEGLHRPVLYVISWQQTESLVLSLLESGVDQYMTLPVNFRRLRAKLTRELDNR